jgi:hypothetical protein
VEIRGKYSSPRRRVGQLKIQSAIIRKGTIESDDNQKSFMTRNALVSRIFILAALTLAALGTSLVHAQTQKLARRLILKDGSYQAITQYEVKGDRVRYLSAERNEWEELPASMVDWPATEKYEKERAAAPALPEAALIDKQSAEDRDAEQMHLPQVAPGLHLPESSGMFMLDNFQGQPQLDEVQQDEGGIDEPSKASLIRGALTHGAGAKQSIELQGDHASVYSHVAVPSIYINPDDEEDQSPPPGETASAAPSQPSLDAPRQRPEQPEQPQKATVPFDRYRIVRVKVKSGKRIVGDVKRAANGSISVAQDSVKTTIDRVGSGWLKLTPIEDLAPGEYAIVETRGPDALNLYIWPFSVNPKAGANKNPWTPDTIPSSPTEN